MKIPSLIGVVHLRALPGSPGHTGDLASVARACARDAQTLADAGFQAVLVENYGDSPFEPGAVSAVTVAALTRCALAAREAAPALALGINVLRNDAEAALGIAVATDAAFIRVNVHTGARLTDQGMIEGRAHRTVRLRRELGATNVQLMCDVDVKHSSPLAPRPLRDEAHDLATRGHADAILVTGAGTGRGVELGHVDEVQSSVTLPVLVASGVTEAMLPHLWGVHGVIVGSCLRADGVAGGPIDEALAKRFVSAFFASRRPPSEARLDTSEPGATFRQH